MPTTETIELVTCGHCEEDVKIERAPFRYNNDPLCDDCYYDHFLTCENCSEIILTNDSYSHHETYYCETCYNEIEDDTSSAMRDYATGKLAAYTGTEQGTIITSPRIFSAEIEAYAPEHDDIWSLSEQIASAFGISTDGSLHGDLGIEIQTPQLQGANGQKAIEAVCKELNGLGFTTDRSCGLHVHLDGKGLDNRAAIKQLMTLYILFEDVLLSFLPPSRRSNRYCNLLRNDFHLQEIQNAEDVEELEAIWYREDDSDQREEYKKEKYHNSRYHGLNLHPLFASGHLEIRYHSGTTNARKILEWTNLHQRMADHAASERSIGTTRISCMTDLKEKTEALYDMLNLSPESRAYFKDRQKTFNKTSQDKDEEMTKDVCVV